MLVPEVRVFTSTEFTFSVRPLEFGCRVLLNSAVALSRLPCLSTQAQGRGHLLLGKGALDLRLLEAQVVSRVFYARDGRTKAVTGERDEKGKAGLI